MSNHDDEETRRLATKQSSPAWLPISILLGTSLAIGIPILMFRKAKAASLKLALENPSAAPPRRAAPSSSSSSSTAVILPKSKHHRHRIRSLPTTTTSTEPKSSDWDSSSPSILTALSQSTTSNALFAGKAFLIATTLVGISACGLVYTVQHLTGAYTVPEFARRMRYWTDQNLTPIKDRIYRGPESDEERKAMFEAAPFGIGMDEEWTWEEAEKRLQKAYDQGGFTLWAQVALRELEAEARIERAKRQCEIATEARSRNS